MLGCQLLLW